MSHEPHAGSCPSDEARFRNRRTRSGQPDVHLPDAPRSAAGSSRSVPQCGMALEPKTAAAKAGDKGDSAELRDMLLRFWVAGIFVPAVPVISVLTFVLWLWLGPEPRLAYASVNALAVFILIIACPCALGLATPMSACWWYIVQASDWPPRVPEQCPAWLTIKKRAPLRPRFRKRLIYPTFTTA